MKRYPIKQYPNNPTSPTPPYSYPPIPSRSVLAPGRVHEGSFGGPQPPTSYETRGPRVPFLAPIVVLKESPSRSHPVPSLPSWVEVVFSRNGPLSRGVEKGLLSSHRHVGRSRTLGPRRASQQPGHTEYLPIDLTYLSRYLSTHS